jgi:hypothetical protein
MPAGMTAQRRPIWMHNRLQGVLTLLTGMHACACRRHQARVRIRLEAFARLPRSSRASLSGCGLPAIRSSGLWPQGRLAKHEPLELYRGASAALPACTPQHASCVRSGTEPRWPLSALLSPVLTAGSVPVRSFRGSLGLPMSSDIHVSLPAARSARRIEGVLHAPWTARGPMRMMSAPGPGRHAMRAAGGL